MGTYRSIASGEGRRRIGEPLRWALADDTLRLLQHEPGSREGRPVDVHQMRTAVRGLRSRLWFFKPVLEPHPASVLKRELRWLAGELGTVRDLDVLDAQLREASAALGVVAESDPIFERIDRLQSEARAALLGTFGGDRYARLRALVIAEARSPTLRKRANHPAGPFLADRLGRDWRRFRKALRSASAEAPSDELHELRKRAKRTKYAAETAAKGPGGRAARRIGKRAGTIQRWLGEMRDAVIAERFLREMIAAADFPSEGPARNSAEVMIEDQRCRGMRAWERFLDSRKRIGGS